MSQFKKGVSGNPAGRKPGSVNQRTRLVKLLEPHAENLINKAVELALAGDSIALRLCIERIIPKVKNNPLSITLPDQKYITAQDLIQEVLNSISGQELGIEELKCVLEILKHPGVDQADEAEKRKLIEGFRVFEEELRVKYQREY